MRGLLLFSAVLTVACRDRAGNSQQDLAQVAPTWDSLVGIIHPPEPVAYSDSGGMTLGSPDTSRWGMSVLIRDQIRYLTLDSMHHHTGGMAYWRVIDATALPPLRTGQEFVWVDCALDDSIDASIVAIGVWNDTTLSRISYAVRPSVSHRRFELLPINRVSCVVEKDRT